MKSHNKNLYHRGTEVRNKKFNYYFCILCVFVVNILGSGLSGLAQGPTYAGVAKCKLCHPKQHKIWSESRHARAFEALKAAEQKDPKCLACHVTGYRETGQATPEMSGVQCEACHGPGSLFITVHAKKDKEGAQKAGLIARPDQEKCKSCHNQESPNFMGFDYTKMWEQIKH